MWWIIFFLDCYKIYGEFIGRIWYCIYLFVGIDIMRRSYVLFVFYLFIVRGLYKGFIYCVYILYNILEGWVCFKLSE